jgi:RNA polymerase sigma-70 factor (ECF subfamily)
MTDWQEVVEQHGPLVWRTGYRLLGNDADASDCFQKVFLDALQITRREPVRRWPALLRRLATVRALDLMRDRYRRRDRCEPLSEAAEATGREPLPEQHAQAAELTEQLRAALAELPAQQAQVFCHRWLDGLSYEQIAEQLDLDTNSVGVLLHRARRRLQQLLVRFIGEGSS